MTANALYDIVGPGAFGPLLSPVDANHPATGTPVWGPDLPYGDSVEWTFPDYIWTPGPAGDYARWPFANDVRYAGDNAHFHWPGAFAFGRFRMIEGGFDPATPDHRQWVAICSQPLGDVSVDVDLRKCSVPAFDPTTGGLQHVRVMDLPVANDSPLVVDGIPLRLYPRRPPDLFMVRVTMALRFTQYSQQSGDVDDGSDPTLSVTILPPACGPLDLTESVTMTHPGAVVGEGLMLRAGGSAYGYSTPDKLIHDLSTSGGGALIDPGEALFRNDELGTLTINVSGLFHSVDITEATRIEVYPLWEAPISPDTAFLDLPLGTPTTVRAGAYDLGKLKSRPPVGNVTTGALTVGDSTPGDPAETPTKTATGDQQSGAVRR